jgi:hypothetical protein
MLPLSVAFVGARTGRWRVERLETIAGEPLASASHLEVLEGLGAAGRFDAAWFCAG